jgi:5'(3')-deoxyribonucleotidase
MRITFNPINNKTFIDLDGVLADFDAFVLKNMGRTFNHQDGPADTQMWDFLSSVENMYFKLEPTPYAFKLFDLVMENDPNAEILTAIPRRTSMPSAEQDKRDWVKKYFGDIPVNIGPYSKDKWKHADCGDILIDDRKDNIEAWVTKGEGVGILHVYDDYPATAAAYFKEVNLWRS